MNPARSVVLFLPEVAKDMDAMFPLATATFAKGYGVEFLITNPSLVKFREDVEKMGGQFRRVEVGRRNSYALGQLWDTFVIKLHHVLLGKRHHSDFGSLESQLRRAAIRKMMFRYCEHAESLLASIRPAWIFISSDRLVTFQIAALKACRRLGIPSVVPPIANPDADGMVFTRKTRPVYLMDSVDSPGWKKWISENLPDQVYPSKHGKMLYMDAPATRALDDAGVLPPKPWGMGGGLSDRVCADGFGTARRLIRDGTPAEKIVVTGHPVHDSLFHARSNLAVNRAALISENAFVSDRKILLLAVPQLAEHGICSWEDHWQEIDYLVGSMADQGQNLVLSLHPRMVRQKYEYLESKFHCRISSRSTKDLIGAADIFVAAYSSTIEWAVLCGIPTITVDFYGIDANTFDDFPGVLKINAKEKFPERLSQLIQDPEYYRAIETLQIQGQCELAPFDGQSAERIIRSAEDLLRPSRTPDL